METKVMEILRDRGYKCELKRVAKGGVMKDAIVIIGDSHVLPTYYPNSLGDTPEEVAEAIIKHYENDTMSEKISIDTEELKNYEAMKSKLALAIRPRNEEDETAITQPYLDLELIVKIPVEIPGAMNGSIKVTRQLVEAWGISKDVVFEEAKANMPEAEINSLAKVMSEMYGVPEELIPGADSGLVYISTSDKNDGAVFLAYPTVFASMAEKYDSDVMIIPSSIHELLAVPFDGFDKNETTQMICEVNENNVVPEERLADHAYIYRRSTGIIEIFG